MSIQTVKVLSLKAFKEFIASTNEFKELLLEKSISVRKAKKTGNLYGVNELEELVCYFAPDTDFTKDINVLKQRKVDEDGAVEEWYFAVNGSAPENVAVL